MGSELDVKLAILSREYDAAFQDLAGRAGVKMQTPTLAYPRDIQLPHFYQGKMLVPYRMANELPPQCTFPQSAESSIMPYFNRIVNGNNGVRGKPGRSRPFVRPSIDVVRAESLRAFRVASLAGPVLHAAKCPEYEEFIGSRMLVEREQSSPYWFFDGWTRTWSGLSYLLHHPAHGKHANWMASWIREGVRAELEHEVAVGPGCNLAGKDYAAQFFLENLDEEVRDHRFAHALTLCEAAKIHHRVPLPNEGLNYHLYSRNRPDDTTC
jgi:hypothetical protein